MGGLGNPISSLRSISVVLNEKGCWLGTAGVIALRVGTAPGVAALVEVAMISWSSWGYEKSSSNRKDFFIGVSVSIRELD